MRVEIIVRSSKWFKKPYIRTKIHLDNSYFETTDEPHGALNETFMALDNFQREQIKDKLKQINYHNILDNGNRNRSK